MTHTNHLLSDLKSLSNPSKAKLLSGFFKTANGQYGEGDKFLGITVPQSRIIAKNYSGIITLDGIKSLLNNKFHEVRLVSLLILIDKFEKSVTNTSKSIIVDFYLSHTEGINNWDLVDLSAPRILGNYLVDKNDRGILYKLVKSSNLWEKRISIISTLALIKNNQFDDTIKISELLLDDSHDLIHKACGWMLREMGKMNEKVLLGFLDRYHKVMPRTMLRYSLERLSKKNKKHYMEK